ncbi:hypothetical protein [Bacillus sp. S/N-304-OC-R1]|uniref:hypothetical protein n=1 Tax=Bacillus sp. S/N-304-OC-R1 TaxID=2758034 RepID=UPI001C8EF6E9|nr:hypothetical protein [Bacillus sp. S/N-304-OC-R1]MBY0123511.1 hypothetical protein [Bacillus sp. S/N-304-OC-R1]
MDLNVQLLKGLLAPNTLVYQIMNAEKVRGLWKKAALLCFMSIILYALYGFYGVGMDFLTKEITEFDMKELETMKLLVIVGRLIWGVIYSILVLFGFSVILWATLDMSYIKIVVVQLFVLCILLFEKAVVLPICILLGIGLEASPFSIGVIARYLSTSSILVYFLSHFSLFKLWAVIFQYKILKGLSERNPKTVLIMIIIVNLLIWLVSSLLSYLEIERLI